MEFDGGDGEWSLEHDRAAGDDVPDLDCAVEAAGEYLDYLVISDQPLTRPTKYVYFPSRLIN